MKFQNTVFEDLKNDSSLSLENIYAVSIAESGAQGSNGSIVVYSVENNKIIIREGNACYGDYDIEILAELFLPLQILNFDHPEGNTEWQWEYMGGGNHLWIRSTIYPELRKAVNHPHGIINKMVCKLHFPPLRWYMYHTEGIVKVLNNKLKEG